MLQILGKNYIVKKPAVCIYGHNCSDLVGYVSELYRKSGVSEPSILKEIESFDEKKPDILVCIGQVSYKKFVASHRKRHKKDFDRSWLASTIESMATVPKNIEENHGMVLVYVLPKKGFFELENLKIFVDHVFAMKEKTNEF